MTVIHTALQTNKDLLPLSETYWIELNGIGLDEIEFHLPPFWKTKVV